MPSKSRLARDFPRLVNLPLGFPPLLSRGFPVASAAFEMKSQTRSAMYFFDAQVVERVDLRFIRGELRFVRRELCSVRRELCLNGFQSIFCIHDWCSRQESAN